MRPRLLRGAPSDQARRILTIHQQHKARLMIHFSHKKTPNTIIVLNCRFGTVASYYCTSPRHRLSGNPKLRCLPDGSWDGAPPDCRLKDAKPSTVGGGFLNKPGLPPTLGGGGGGDRRPGGVDYTRVRSRRPFLKTQRENSAGKR